MFKEPEVGLKEDESYVAKVKGSWMDVGVDEEEDAGRNLGIGEESGVRTVVFESNEIVVEILRHEEVEEP